MFYQVEGRECRDNCATYMGRMYQARYLTGIVAGLQTKSGGLGYVAALPVSEVIRGINAFALGARRRILAGWDVFYGPIYDKQGLLRVTPGEALAGDTPQREMDWYVMGVQVEG